MFSKSTFTEIQENPSTLRKGGLLIQGQARSSRQPVHMMLVVDTSGSMEMEHKLDSVKKSIELLLPLLISEDRISLITFADNSKKIFSKVAPTPEQRSAIQYQMSSFNPDGSTNMSAGLLETRDLIEASSSGRKQGILLLTDGHANIGVHSEAGLNDIVKRILNDNPGLTITTVAYGADHNTELLTAIAKEGGGAYNVVHNLEDVATVFGDILGGLVSVSAQNVVVSLPAGAEALSSYRTEQQADGTINIFVGDVYAEAEITVLFRSSPSLGPIRIKGTNMSNLNVIDESITPDILHEMKDIPVNFVIADYKQRTADILRSFRQSNQPRSFSERLDLLITQIQEDERINDHPLKAMLIEDLKHALEVSKANRSLSQNETVEMAQHSAYFGLSKGLRSHTNPTHGIQRQRATMMMARMAFDDDNSLPVPPSIASSPPSNLTSPFANRLQSQFASVMRTASNTAAQEEETEGTSTMEHVD